MAFPTIRSSNSGDITPATLSTTITLPTGHSQGDLLIIGVSLDGSRTISAPTGWTLLANPTNTTLNRHPVWYKTRGATESNPTISWEVVEELGTWYSIAITAGTWSGIPEIATYYASSATVNPPSLTASWGSMDNLWLALAGWDYNRTSTTTPTNYTLLTYKPGLTTTSAGHRTFYRQLKTATEDPGTFTISGTNSYYAHTVVIKPYTLPPDMSVKIGGTWRSAAEISVNIGGSWKTATNIYVKISNVWREMFPGGLPRVATPSITNVVFAADFNNFPYYMLSYRVYNNDASTAILYSDLSSPPTYSLGSTASDAYKSRTHTNLNSNWVGAIYAQAKITDYPDSVIASEIAP